MHGTCLTPSLIAQTAFLLTEIAKPISKFWEITLRDAEECAEEQLEKYRYVCCGLLHQIRQLRAKRDASSAAPALSTTAARSMA